MIPETVVRSANARGFAIVSAICCRSVCMSIVGRAASVL